MPAVVSTDVVAPWAFKTYLDLSCNACTRGSVPISPLRVEEADDLLARDGVKRLTQIQRKCDSSNKIRDISPLLQRMPARRGAGAGCGLLSGELPPDPRHLKVLDREISELRDVLETGHDSRLKGFSGSSG